MPHLKIRFHSFVVFFSLHCLPTYKCCLSIGIRVSRTPQDLCRWPPVIQSWMKTHILFVIFSQAKFDTKQFLNTEKNKFPPTNTTSPKKYSLFASNLKFLVESLLCTSVPSFQIELDPQRTCSHAGNETFRNGQKVSFVDEGQTIMSG